MPGRKQLLECDLKIKEKKLYFFLVFNVKLVYACHGKFFIEIQYILH